MRAEMQSGDRSVTDLVESRRDARRSLQRQHVIDGLAASVAKKGYPSTTIADIAREARVSRSAIYEHFADKEAVYLALHHDVAEATLSTLQAAWSESRDMPSWEQGVRHLVASYLRAMASGPHYLTQILIETTTATPSTRDARLDARRRFGEFLVGLSRDMATSFGRVEVLTPARAIVAMVGTIELVHLAATNGPEAVLALEDDVTDLFTRMLGKRSRS